jgi:hypothetical protein
MFCPYCGWRNPEGSLFCGACGVSLAYAAPSGYAYAPQLPARDDPRRWLMPIGRSGWAIAAGYVALFSLIIWPLGIASIILAFAAWADMGRNPEKLGKGRALFAFLVGLGSATLFAALLSTA